jgi:hypothetical protein
MGGFFPEYPWSSAFICVFLAGERDGRSSNGRPPAKSDFFKGAIADTVPSTLMFEEALSMARRSSGVSSRFVHVEPEEELAAKSTA